MTFKEAAMDKTKTKTILKTAALTALTAALCFTPAGFVHIGTLEATLLPIAVALGALYVGPGAGALLGAVFGAASFARCFGASVFGAALLAESPVYTFVLCVGPRLLAGWGTGLVCRPLNYLKYTRPIAPIAATLASVLLNSGFFLTALLALFGDGPYLAALMDEMAARSGVSFLVAFAGLNVLLELAAALAVGALLCFLRKAVARRGMSAEEKAEAERSDTDDPVAQLIDEHMDEALEAKKLYEKQQAAKKETK